MSVENPDESFSSRSTIGLLTAAIVLTTLVSFWPVARNGYINYDDVDYVLGNEMVLRGWSVEGVGWAFQCMNLSYWHPLTWMSHMADIHVFGVEHPERMHMESLAIHAVSAALLMLLLARMTGSVWRSALVAALFALHPQRVESVAWVAERKDVLWVLFALLTLHAYVSWVQRGGAWRYWLTIVLYAMGTMAKPMIVTLPCVMLLLDFWPLGRIRGTVAASLSIAQRSVLGLVIEKLPLFALAAGLCIVTYIAQHQVGAMDPLEHVPLGSRVANAMVAYATYIRQVVWPVDLAVIYPYPQATPIWQWLPATIAILGITVIAIVCRRKWPHVTVGWLWFIGTLIPVIGIVQVGEQARADRYTYFPVIGLTIAIVWSIPRMWFAGQLGGLATAAALVVLGVLAWLTNVQCRYWRDTGALFAHTLEVTERNPLAHCIYGQHLCQLNDYAQGERELKKALELREGYVPALTNLANIHASRRDYQTAAQLLRQALVRKPEEVLTRYNLAIALTALRRESEAAIEYREVLRLQPDLHPAAVGLSEILVRQGRTNEAVDVLATSVSLDPGSARLHYELGRVLLEAGRAKEAAAQFEESLRIKPDFDEARQALERANAKMGGAAESPRSDPKP